MHHPLDFEAQAQYWHLEKGIVRSFHEITHLEIVASKCEGSENIIKSVAIKMAATLQLHSLTSQTSRLPLQRPRRSHLSYVLVLPKWKFNKFA